MSSKEGTTLIIPLYVDSCEEAYQLEIRKKDYETAYMNDIMIHEHELCTIHIHMNRKKKEDAACICVPPPDHKITAFDGFASIQNIMIHLVQQNEESLVIPFHVYLKNVACSQLYPTWPYEALRAAIKAQFVMIWDRIQSGWYPRKGNEVTIGCFPNDLIFIQDRVLFEPINDIVDELWKECHDASMRDIPPYPQSPLEPGVKGSDVKILQDAINIVASQYPAVSVVVADGSYQERTRHAVCTFQHVFHLTIDGITNQATWEAIHTCAQSIQQDQEEVLGLPSFTKVLRIPSKGKEVSLIQHRLLLISQYYSSIPEPAVNGIFDDDTKAAVLAFQRLLGLSVDGIVDSLTWSQIHQIYEELNAYEKKQ